MKPRVPPVAPRIGLALALAALGAAARITPASAQPLPAAAFRSGDVVAALRASTVADFTARAAVSRAAFTGTDLANVTGVVEIRAADLRTGIGLRDTHLRGAMRTDSFPVIQFQLVGVDPGAARGDTLAVVFQGALTIHGVTRTVRVPGAVVVRAGGVDVTATLAIDMREYGIRPPSRFLGAVKVNPLTTVVVRLEFAGG